MNMKLYFFYFMALENFIKLMFIIIIKKKLAPIKINVPTFLQYNAHFYRTYLSVYLRIKMKHARTVTLLNVCIMYSIPTSTEYKKTILYFVHTTYLKILMSIWCDDTHLKMIFSTTVLCVYINIRYNNHLCTPLWCAGGYMM